MNAHGKTASLRKSGVNRGGLRLLSIFTFAFILGLPAFTGVAQARITKGPVLLRVYKHRAALVWETDSAGSGKVIWKGTGASDTDISSTPVRIDYSIKSGEELIEDRTAFIHKVWIEGLSPDSMYEYRIIDENDETPRYSFKTAPADDQKEIRFVVYGDSRSHPDRHRKVIEQIIKKKPEFVVNGGDFVTNGIYYEQWGPQLFEPIKGLAETVPFYAVRGNHDLGKKHFEELLVPPGEAVSFSFDYGPVHYHGLDNYINTVPELLKRLSEDFKSNGNLWNFVTYHVPSLNIGGHASDWGFPRALPALSSAGVDFTVTGHSHVYERFHPVAPPRGKKGAFVTHITSGGGGAPPYGIASSPFLASAERRLHFCLFTIKGGLLDLEVIDDQGRTIDELTLEKTGGVPDKRYTDTAVSMEHVTFYQHVYRSLAMSKQVRPEKDQPVEVKLRLSPAPSGEGFKATLSLHCDKKFYRLPGEKTVVIQESGASQEVAFTAAPIAGVELPANQHPANSLYLVCRYEGQSGKGEFRISVRYLTR